MREESYVRSLRDREREKKLERVIGGWRGSKRNNRDSI